MDLTEWISKEIHTAEEDQQNARREARVQESKAFEHRVHEIFLRNLQERVKDEKTAARSNLWGAFCAGVVSQFMAVTVIGYLLRGH